MTAVSLRQTRTDERRRGGLMMIPAGNQSERETEFRSYREERECFLSKTGLWGNLRIMAKILRI